MRQGETREGRNSDKPERQNEEKVARLLRRRNPVLRNGCHDDRTTSKDGTWSSLCAVFISFGASARIDVLAPSLGVAASSMRTDFLLDVVTGSVDVDDDSSSTSLSPFGPATPSWP